MVSDYLKPSEVDLDGACFDLPETTPQIRYLICTTPRSGSYMLCRQLLNARLGVPAEYFGEDHIRRICGRWGLQAEQRTAYFRELYARRTTRNGVWGSKLHWRQYARNRDVLEPELAGISHYIYLYRSDIVAQAVSLHLAIVTGIRGFDADLRFRPRLNVGPEDVAHVTACVQVGMAQNQEWRIFFGERKLRPLLVSYEAYIADPAAGNLRIAEFLGLNPSDYRLPPPEPRTRPYPPELEEVRKRLIQAVRAQPWNR